MICVDVYWPAVAGVGAPLVLARPPVLVVAPRAGATADPAAGTSSLSSSPSSIMSNVSCRPWTSPACCTEVSVLQTVDLSCLAPEHQVTRRAPRARCLRSGGQPRPAPLLPPSCSSGYWPSLCCALCLGPPPQASPATYNPTPRCPPRRPSALASHSAKRPRVAGRTCRNLWAPMSLPTQADQRRAFPMLEQGNSLAGAVAARAEEWALVGFGPGGLAVRWRSLVRVAGRRRTPPARRPRLTREGWSRARHSGQRSRPVRLSCLARARSFLRSCRMYRIMGQY